MVVDSIHEEQCTIYKETRSFLKLDPWDILQRASDASLNYALMSLSVSEYTCQVLDHEAACTQRQQQ